MPPELTEEQAYALAVQQSLAEEERCWDGYTIALKASLAPAPVTATAVVQTSASATPVAASCSVSGGVRWPVGAAASPSVAVVCVVRLGPHGVALNPTFPIPTPAAEPAEALAGGNF